MCNNKAKKVIESPKLLIAGASWCSLNICLCIACIWAIRSGLALTATYRDWVGCQIIFIFVIAWIFMCGILALPRWLRVISFHENMIAVKGLYGDKKAIYYKDIRDIVLYRERRGLNSISFIVVSKDKLYVNSLSSEERIKETDRTLVLRNRKATRELLYQVLSSSQRSAFGYRLVNQGI